MTKAARWTVVVGVLVLAGIFVWLPLRGDDPPGQPTRVSQELRDARAKASLRPCPEPEKDWQYDEYAGVMGTCVADGSQVDLGKLLASGNMIVNVWATWCAPCREELPLLQRYADSQDDVRVVTVQVESSQLDGLKLLAELGVTLPVVHDGTGARGPIRDALRVPTALPASYVVVKKGGLSFVSEPRLFTSVEQIDRTFRKVEERLL